MPLFWFEGLSVGVEGIDSQHKGFVDLINKLEAAIDNCRGHLCLFEIVCDLSDYAKIHFATEEQFMRRHEYPDKMKHIEEHEQFIAKVMSICNETELMDNTPDNVLKYMQKWLIMHISDTDKKLGAFLNECGVS